MTSTQPQACDGLAAGGHRRLIVVLAGAAALLVTLLNWLGTSAVPVTEEQFGKLLAANMIRGLTVRPGRLEAQLGQRVRVRLEGREEVTDHVRLELDAAPTAAQLVGWQAAGMTVEQVGEEDQRRRDLGGGLLLVVLLGAGVWHLWSQIRADRKGGGSPRRRLRDLEAALAAGTISQEQFQERAQVIWAEM